ncbi:MAG: apolipoprotein N-acyltransferase [Gammaproteobacteria bacterium]|nr:apolipoprotein N-acyltransferase [Gammaproteobacteria bacterium]
MPKKRSLLLLPADRPGLSQLLFFVFGCITTLGFAPFGWYLLIPLLLLPLLYVCLTLAARDAARHAFWFGFGLFLSGTYWIYISVVIYGNAPSWVALVLMLGLVLIMSTYLWASGWLISRLANGEPWLLLVVAPAAWVFIEWLRGWALSGFPWLALGYSHIDSPLAGWAPVAGVYGVSMALVLSTTALLVAIMTRGRQQTLAIAIALLPWIAGGLLKTAVWTQPGGPPLVATLIQGGVSQDRKWLPEQREPTMNFYRDATLRATDSAIVVWPEVAIPSVTDSVEDYIRSLEAVSRRNAQSILFGILEREAERNGDSKIYNSVVLVDGQRRQVYRKRHLVPFGEYFPVPDTVREWMRMMNLPYSDLSAGADTQALLVAADGTRIAVAICYEDAYGAEQLYALPDAGLLVNVSNDAWFGESIAAHQHLQIARMRSLEVGRYAIRATNTGISAFIGPDGAILDSGPQFEPVVLQMSVEPRTGSTPYVVAGNRPVIGLCLLVVAGFWLRIRAS